MFPRIEVTVDGKPIAGDFYNRLLSISVTDKEGFKSDTVDIELNDDPPMAIPRKGAIIDVRLGYGELRSMGQFTVDKVTCNCLPFKMTIGGKSADLRASSLKQRKERHWDKKKLKDIVSEIASDAGLDASVDGDVGDFEYPWIAQMDEQDFAFLHRLANRHNALFSIKQGRLIFGKQGSGNSASGSFLGSVIVTPSTILQGTCNFETNDRTKYSKVVAYYQDKDQAKRVEIEATGDADGESVFRIPDPFASVEEADKAAQAKAKSLKRGEGTASVTVIGDTSICAGAPLIFQGVRAGLDGVPYIIETATHTFSKDQGYRTQISAKLYDGKSASDGSKKGAGETGASEGGSATTAGENATPAANAPSGTPATPNPWLTGRRYGRIDEN
ncbi:MAG: late control protein D [Delftia acidovorans]|nr:MAG: late control protein D [Delftia acidovorans]